MLRYDPKSQKSDNAMSRSENKYLKNKTEMNLKSYNKERNLFSKLYEKNGKTIVLS